MKLDEYLDMLRKLKVTYYMTSIHKNIEHFVYDMEGGGISKNLMRFCFPVVIVNNGKEIDITEITGYDASTGELIINEVVDNKDSFYE